MAVDKNQASYEIAKEAAAIILSKGSEIDLDWVGVAASCETTIAMVVTACLKITNNIDNSPMARKLVETIAEGALGRIVAMMKGIPHGC